MLACFVVLSWIIRAYTRTCIAGNGNQLWLQGGIDERAEVEAAHVVDGAEVECVQLERRQVEGVEDAELAELDDGLQLLELEDGVDVKDLCLEQGLEGQCVEVVVDGQGLEDGEVDRVDRAQVANVQRVEGQVVELGDIKDAAGLDVGG